MPERKIPVGPAEKNDSDFDLTHAGSYTECTGLIPTPPTDDEEADSYLDIFNYRPPSTEKAAKQNVPDAKTK
ncbi:MAG: hypothetical protein E7418_04930 [Ruminococcaceae bacterium]|nr:hypothetical protein [Oscillospiraceae bacterium]